RADRREYEERVEGFIAERRTVQPTEEVAIESHDTLLPVLERRLASLLPLALHAPEKLVDELRSPADLKARQPVASGYNFWRELKELALLQGRYPEVVASGETLRSLVQFDFIQDIALGLRDQLSVSHWTMYSETAEQLAQRLHSDARLRAQVAEGVGVTLEDF